MLGAGPTTNRHKRVLVKGTQHLEAVIPGFASAMPLGDISSATEKQKKNMGSALRGEIGTDGFMIS